MARGALFRFAPGVVAARRLISTTSRASRTVRSRPIELTLSPRRSHCRAAPAPPRSSRARPTCARRRSRQRSPRHCRRRRPQHPTNPRGRETRRPARTCLRSRAGRRHR
ncbi:MAG: hypothetical protein EBR10_05335 [Planctomycetes bacterium]|nr:hypothetical protein [Planctomycetota bacterium]